MNKIHRAGSGLTPGAQQPAKPNAVYYQVAASVRRLIHKQEGEGVLDTLISLAVIVVGLYLAVFVLSLVVRIIVLVAVGAAVIYLISKLLKGVGDP